MSREKLSDSPLKKVERGYHCLEYYMAANV